MVNKILSLLQPRDIYDSLSFSHFCQNIHTSATGN